MTPTESYSSIEAALRDGLAEIRDEYESEDIPAVKAGIGIAYDALRVVLNRHLARGDDDTRGEELTNPK